jgi:hypothetical protein
MDFHPFFDPIFMFLFNSQIRNQSMTGSNLRRIWANTQTLSLSFKVFDELITMQNECTHAPKKQKNTQKQTKKNNPKKGSKEHSYWIYQL